MEFVDYVSGNMPTKVKFPESEKPVGNLKMKINNKKHLKSAVTGKSVGNYPVGDFLIRIKNASMAGKKTFEFPLNKFVLSVAKTLVKEKYLREVIEEDGLLKVSLNYRKKEPVITNIKLISTPGLRVYMQVEELEAKKGPSIFIISTPQGIMSSKEAIKKKSGGEVIAEVL